MQTQYQALAQLNRLVGANLVIRPEWELIATKVDGTMVSALWRTARTKQRSRDMLVTHRGQCLMSWRLMAGRWTRQPDLAHDEVLSEPEIVALIGRGLTPKEYAARVERERLAYRVGTDTDPRDSHARQAQGYIQLLS